jgi:hypothetical protein
VDSITLGQALGWLLAAATAFVTLYKVIDIIATRLKPQKDLREHMAEIDRKLLRDKDRLDEQDKANAVIFRALYAQINHELSGNGNDILRKSRDEIQEYLTNR